MQFSYAILVIVLRAGHSLMAATSDMLPIIMSLKLSELPIHTTLKDTLGTCWIAHQVNLRPDRRSELSQVLSVCHFCVATRQATPSH